MHVINRDFDRVDDDIIGLFRSFSTPIISDVQSKNRWTMESQIKPVFQEAFIAGSALTIKASPGDNLVLHRALSLAHEGDVLVVDADGYTEAGIWGELMSLTATEKGLSGVVVDGAVRDITEIEEIGFGVFSAAVSPKGSHKEVPGSINIPITCGGVHVSPGDIVVGDANGVVVVPSANAEQVIERCERKKSAEANLRDSSDVTEEFSEKFEDVFRSMEDTDHS